MAVECQIRFREEGHEYSCDTHLGQTLPSVTQVLSVAGVSPSYDHVDPGVLKTAADRGTALHACVELFEQDRLDFDSVDPQVQPYFDGYLKYRMDHPVKKVTSEIRLGSCKVGVAGTLDLLEEPQEGRDRVIELKTTSRLYKSAYVQACGYADLYYRTMARRQGLTLAAGPADLYVLRVTGEGKYHLRKVDVEVYEPVWHSALTLYKFKEGKL